MTTFWASDPSYIDDLTFGKRRKISYDSEFGCYRVWVDDE